MSDIQTIEELDAVLHWRNKHAIAIKERDALQQRLNAADQRVDELTGAATKARDVLRNLLRDQSCGTQYAAAQMACHQINAALAANQR